MNPWTPERIKALRKRLGFSQEDLARAIGIQSGVSVSRWERGERSPDRRSAAALDKLVGGKQ